MGRGNFYPITAQFRQTKTERPDADRSLHKENTYRDHEAGDMGCVMFAFLIPRKALNCKAWPGPEGRTSSGCYLYSRRTWSGGGIFICG